MADDLDKELDHLYALEPAAFVAERDKLVRELRKSDRREEAEQVKGLRKPSVSAWAINQLTRQARREIDLLLDAGHRLRGAQQGLLAGEDPSTFEEARRTQRSALASLRKAASRILAEAGRESETTLNRIIATLQAAAVSEEGRELLAQGRLAGDLEATGFELLAPLAEGAPHKPSTSRRPQPQKKRDAPRKAASAVSQRQAQERQRREDRRRLDEARSELREARAAARAAAKDLRAAEQEAQKARRELGRVEARLDERQSAAAEAQSAVERAEKQVHEAEQDGA